MVTISFKAYWFLVLWKEKVNIRILLKRNINTIYNVSLCRSPKWFSRYSSVRNVLPQNLQCHCFGPYSFLASSWYRNKSLLGCNGQLYGMSSWYFLRIVIHFDATKSCKALLKKFSYQRLPLPSQDATDSVSTLQRKISQLRECNCTEHPKSGAPKEFCFCHNKKKKKIDSQPSQRQEEGKVTWIVYHTTDIHINKIWNNFLELLKSGDVAFRV